MTVMSVSEAKKHLLQLVRGAQEQGKVYSLTRKGSPAAVLMSEDEYRSVKETLEVLSDPRNSRGFWRAGQTSSRGGWRPWRICLSGYRGSTPTRIS